MKITAIILAAGLSRRMKRNKMNLQIDGDSMLQTVFDTTFKTRFHEIIVVRTEQVSTAALIRPPKVMSSSWVTNRSWKSPH